MPDERFAVPNATGGGRWNGMTIDGPVTLFVETNDVVLRLEQGGLELSTPFARLTGAAWRANRLTLHAPDGEAHLAGAATLARAWALIVQRACPAPEVTRGLRSLGSRQSGASRGQLRFFAPLLQARRRLEQPEPLEWQVTRFDAVAVGERLAAIVAAIAAERFPASAPHRRALESHLDEATESLFVQLKALHRRGKAVHEAEDPHRFEAWRLWSAGMREVFVEADRAWSRICRVLGELP